MSSITSWLVKWYYTSMCFVLWIFSLPRTQCIVDIMSRNTIAGPWSSPSSCSSLRKNTTSVAHANSATYSDSVDDKVTISCLELRAWKEALSRPMEKQYQDWDLESSRDAKDASAHAYSWVPSSALNNKPLLLIACTYLSQYPSYSTYVCCS